MRKLIRHIRLRINKEFAYYEHAFRTVGKSRLFVAIIPVVLSAWLAIYGNQIKTSFIIFKIGLVKLLTAELPNFIIYWPTIFFIVVFFWWLFLLAGYLHSVNVQAEERFDKATGAIKAAIHRAPDLTVLYEYDKKCRTISSLLFELRELVRNDKETPEDLLIYYETTFQEILKSICEISSKFFKKDSGLYSASIMLRIDNNSENKSKLKTILSKSPLLHLEDFKLESLAGILYMKKELQHPKHSILNPPISLPIKLLKPGQTPVFFPGACKSIDKGEYCIEDTAVLKNHYAEYGKHEKEEAHRFFTQNYHQIKSFVSIAIPKLRYEPGKKVNKAHGDHIIGVLNINSSETDILSIDSEYHTTFYSLIRSLLNISSSYLDEYIDLFVKKGKFIT